MTRAERHARRLQEASKRQLVLAIYDLRQRLDRTEFCLQFGKPLNHTGEIQLAISTFESAVGAYARLSEVAELIEEEGE